MTREEQLKKWQWAVTQMRKLIELNAPESLKAQLLIHILFPRMIEITNTEQYAGQHLAEMIMNGLCMRSGKCVKCKSAYQSDEILNLCPRCAAEFDQWEAKMMEGIPESEQ